MKRIKFIIIVLGAIVFVGMVVFLNSTPKEQTYFTGLTPLSQLSLKDFNFPKTLPTLELGTMSPYSETDARKIAANLKFNGKVQIVNDAINGQTYYWSKNGISLVVYSKIRKIVYTFKNLNPQTRTKLTNQEIINKANDFLVKNAFLSEGSVIFSFLKILPVQGVYNKNSTKQANYFYQVYFTYTLNNMTVITLTPNVSPIIVNLMQDGTVSSVSVNDIGNVKKSSTEYKLKNFQEVSKTLGDAQIARLDNSDVTLKEFVTNPIKKLVFSKIDAGYLLDPSTSQTLNPVYILSGTATVATSQSNNKDVETVFYMPAISK